MGGWGNGLAEWWVAEVGADPAYRDEVIPLLLEVLGPQEGDRYLDLGCGEGSVLHEVAVSGARVIGCDLSFDLARRAAAHGPVVVARLPGLPWVAPGACDGAYAVLVLEHLDAVAPFFSATAEAVRPGGRLAVVANHPVCTAPGSAPVVDPDDGEMLWRWGDYFGEGVTVEPAGAGEIVFHHRSLQDLLTAAAAAGWALELLRERPVGAERAAADPLLGAQRGLPRLLGVGWRRV
jgi:SAM-dependent methyltransferase